MDKKEYYKRWYQENKVHRKKYFKKWREENRDTVKRHRREAYKRNKKRINIRDTTRYLLRKLNIKKEGLCPDCNQFKELEIHHITYTRDDFILICKECHLKRHQNNLKNGAVYNFLKLFLL